MRFATKGQLTRWALQAQPLWLLLDYDGTLAEFTSYRDMLAPDKKVVNLLTRLSVLPGVRLSIISGRSLSALRLLLPVPGIFLCGTYGVQVLPPGGEETLRVNDPAIRPILDEIKPKWQRLIAGKNGFYLEDKGLALTLHASLAGEAEAVQVVSAAQQAAGGMIMDGQLFISWNGSFLEIAPPLANKKETVLFLARRYPLIGAGMLYIGDDRKDEEAFGAVHDRQGVAVRVGHFSEASSPTEADFVLESPAQVNQWLADLLRRLERGPERG